MNNTEGKSGNALFGRILIIILSLVLSTLIGTFSAFGVMGILSFVLSAVAAAILAFGFFTTQSWVVFISMPAALIVSNFLFDTGYTPIFSVIFFMPGVALAYSACFRLKRSEAVAAATAAQVLMSLVYAVMICNFESGSVTPDGVLAQYMKIIEPIEGVLTNASLYNAEGEVVYLYTADQVEQLMSYMRVFLPSIVITMASMMAYLTSSIFCFLLKRTKALGLLGTPDGKWTFSMSKVSAYVFCGSYLVYIISSGSEINAVSATAFNLFIILLLGFARCGLTYAKQLIKRGVSKWTFVFPVILFIINPVSLLLVLALVGVIMTLMPNKKGGMEDKSTPKH